MVYWSASNNSSFLNGHREAPTLLAAVRAGRAYLRNELNGEGSISFFHDPEDMPFRVDQFSMFTGWKWEINNF